jgi:hypothetical protein
MTGRKARKGTTARSGGQIQSMCADRKSAVQVRQRRGRHQFSTEVADNGAPPSPARAPLSRKRNGDRYVEQTRNLPAHTDDVLIRMRPERWLTTDYSRKTTPLGLNIFDGQLSRCGREG